VPVPPALASVTVRHALAKRMSSFQRLSNDHCLL
jgi:hypothetical protein